MTVLTKNQSKVFDVLEKHEGPLSAYAILDELRDDGFKAPLQVYRALDKLITLGHVHRLESLSAFTACSHRDHGHHNGIFTICETCDRVTEIHDPALTQAIQGLAQKQKFIPKTAVIELRGLCKDCQ